MVTLQPTLHRPLQLTTRCSCLAVVDKSCFDFPEVPMLCKAPEMCMGLSLVAFCCGECIMSDMTSSPA